MTIPVFAPSKSQCAASFPRLWVVDVNSRVHWQFDVVMTDETIQLRQPLVEFYSFKIRNCWRVLALFLSIDKWLSRLLKNRILTSPLNGQNCNHKMKTEVEWMRAVANISFAPFQTTKIFITVAVLLFCLLGMRMNSIPPFSQLVRPIS